jgi:hypothetical protein
MPRCPKGAFLLLPLLGVLVSLSTASAEAIFGSAWTPAIRYTKAYDVRGLWESHGLGPRRPIMIPAAKEPFSRTISYDDETGLLAYGLSVGGTHASYTHVLTMQDYMDLASRDVMDRQIRDWSVAFLGRITERQGGLLEIDIPIKFPGAIGRFLGEGANLRVSGSEQITFSGETTYRLNEIETEAGRRSKFPQLDMQQALNVNLEGTIGDKIHVLVDHASGAKSATQNKIRIRYEGDEDEIIQEIQMGETSLDLPATQFVTQSGQHKGLFGVKLTAKAGPLDVITIASKQEGKSKSKSFDGQSAETEVQINDKNFIRRTYYVVDGFATRLPNWYPNEVESLRVYVDDRDGTNDEGTVQAYAYAVENEIGTIDTGDTNRTDLSNFDELEPIVDYVYESGILQFRRRVEEDHVVAVAFHRLSGQQVGITDGEILHLKMVKPEDPDPSDPVWGQTWEYELKNVYYLGGTDLPEGGVEISVRRLDANRYDYQLDEEGNATPYIEILGLDMVNSTGQTTPDGFVDSYYLDEDDGLLWFPRLEPFCDTLGFTNDLGQELPELEDQNCRLYTERNLGNVNSTYVIDATYREAQSTFQLGFDVVEGSERVVLNGRTLTRGSDYTIVYTTGQLTFIGEAAEEARLPESEISIDYEYAPFISLAQKTLAGVRAVYHLAQDAFIGTTWLYQSKGTPSERPRLGEEPTRTVVGDVNGSWNLQADFLSSLIDGLPLVETDERSDVKLNAEVALSVPNPNTKDEIYIDDMEGVREYNGLGLIRTYWSFASVPVGVDYGNREKVAWYNPHDVVKEGDIHPQEGALSSEERDDPKTVLEMKIDSADTSDWGGIMRIYSKTGADFSRRKFLEVWINDQVPVEARTGKVYFNFGSISEDFYPINPAIGPNDELDTEDQDRNGVLGPGEDTGLDNNNPDDTVFGGDDYDFDSEAPETDPDKYSQINGTEGNLRLDTEDLDENGDLDVTNSYYTLVLDLADDSQYEVIDNDTIVSGNHWRFFRIPLDSARVTVGNPDWQDIEYVRVWAKGFNSTRKLQIASMDVVGNRWLEEPISAYAHPDSDIVLGPDESFSVRDINNKEDPEYRPPFGVETDRATGKQEREQSLALEYSNLEGGHEARARLDLFRDRGEDYTDYGELSFYLHGQAEAGDKPVFFIRLVSDSTTRKGTTRPDYYEFSKTVNDGWSANATEGSRTVSFSLNRFSQLKIDLPDSIDLYSETDPNGQTFTMSGRPSLTSVKQIVMGVTNPAESGDPMSGEIWLDELRLIEVRRVPGWAQRATVDIKGADLFSLSANLQRIDSEFHSLRQDRGSGTNSLSYNINTSINAGKFMEGLGVKMPFTAKLSRQISEPRLLTNSDIELTEQQSAQERTTKESTSYSLGLSKPGTSQNPFAHILFDPFSFRASYSRNFTVTPTNRDTTRTIRGSMEYKLAPKARSFRLFRETRFYYLPTRFDVSIDASVSHLRKYAVENNVQSRRMSDYKKTATGTFSTGYQPFPSLKSDFSLTAARDLTFDRKDPVLNTVNIGLETKRNTKFSSSYSPTVFSWLRPSFNYSAACDDDHRPELTRPEDDGTIRNLKQNSSLRSDVTLDLARAILGDGQGKSGGGRRRGDKESQDGDQEEKDEPSRILEPLKTFLRRLSDVRGNFTHTRSTRFDRTTYEPTILYQLGFSDPDDDAVEEKKGNQYSVSSNYQILSNLKLGMMYKFDDSKRWYSGSTSQERKSSKDFDLSWSGLEKLPMFAAFTRTTSLSSKLSLESSESGNIGKSPRKESNRVSWEPLMQWTANWKNGLKTRLVVRRSKAENVDKSGSGRQTLDTSGAYRFELDYAFSAPQGLGIPLLGRVKFTSNLDVSLNFEYQKEKKTEAALDEDVERGTVRADKTRISILPSLKYSFSRNVTGSLNFKFLQTDDRYLNRKDRTIGMSVSALFRF